LPKQARKKSISDAGVEKDAAIPFPHFMILKASAGSGKTHALTRRFVQFILSDKVPRNHLRNILAITFSNNAAKEMRVRILLWLKDLSFKDPKKLEELSSVLSLRKEQIPGRAEALVDEILENYTEFQVRTIDSFMASIFKASAIDLGYSPDFEIVMSSRPLMTYAFNRFLRRVREGAREARFIEELLDLILENKGGEDRFPWDPSKDLLGEMEDLHFQLSGLLKEVSVSGDAEEVESLKEQVRERAEELNRQIERSDLRRSVQSTFPSILEAVKKGRYADLIGRGLKSPPVLKPRRGEGDASYPRILALWEELGRAIKSYTASYSLRYYSPYVKAYEAFRDRMESVKKEEAIVFIEDVNKKLSDYLDREIVPDIYLRLGDTVYHYLVDEFQDTSPIQWNNLLPLIENSLAQGGSFFAVGDTKQAIYGFRNADYRIMRGLESKNPFPSAHHDVKELTVNYRSDGDIVRFNEKLFQRVVRKHARYEEAASGSGLTDYRQAVKEGREGAGFANVVLCERREDGGAEKRTIQELIKRLKGRGYRYSDMAILTFRNDDVVNVTTWLDEVDVPFISFSSLDVRTRKLTEEILFLLTFLDSPPDDLSFAGFLLGDIFRRALDRKGRKITLQGIHDFLFRHRKSPPLYKWFEEGFPDLWEDYFERLFRSTGYLPLYDLVTEIYRMFEIFETFKEEEATLAKILEVIKDFESQRANNPADFLKFASEQEAGEGDWNIDVPAGVNAVRVMTIHKAKGLGFPVAIVLVYGESSHGFKYVVEDAPEAVHLLKINQKIAEADPSLQRAYEEGRRRDLVNRLNTLYVAFTRAEGELYVVGVQGQKSQFPIDLLQEMEFESQVEEATVHVSQEPDRVSFPLYHHHTPVGFQGTSMAEELNLEERRRGEFFHRVLSSIDHVGDNIPSELEAIIRRVNVEWDGQFPEDVVKRTLLEFLGQEEIKPYFLPSPGRILRKEQEFSDREGHLVRMDRVIIDEASVAVVDFKTGSEKSAEASHIAQLRNYMGILREVYPAKSIEGLIAYVDLKEIRKIT
jgi:ATP-dependent helicase/nuclease subunit A